MVGENPTPYGILALWAVNSLSIVYWDLSIEAGFARPHSLYYPREYSDLGDLSVDTAPPSGPESMPPPQCLASDYLPCSLAKQGDTSNRIGSVRPSVCSSVCLSVNQQRATRVITSLWCSSVSVISSVSQITSYREFFHANLTN